MKATVKDIKLANQSDQNEMMSLSAAYNGCNMRPVVKARIDKDANTRLVEVKDRRLLEQGEETTLQDHAKTSGDDRDH